MSSNYIPLSVRTVYNVSWNPQDLLYGTASIINDDNYVQKQMTFIKPVTLTLNKEDFDGTIVPGAKFNITGVNNVNSITDSNNNSINSITIGSSSIKITPANGNSGTFRIKLKETTVPTGYQGVLGEILLKVTYDDGEVTQIKQITEDGVEINSDYIVTRISNNKGNITIKNTPEVNLIINKIDSLHKDAQGNPIKLANAMFKIELTNVESIRNYEVPTLLGDVDREDGEITFEDAEMIQEYVAGIRQFDEDQRLRADFNSDGVIDTNDATEIQKYLAYKLEPKGLGDINNDGEITIEDAELIQKYRAGIIQFDENQKLRADVNGDGEINIDDATKIQKYLAYTIVYAKSSENGEIKLEGIVPKGRKENKITVRITEVGVPEVASGEYYYKILKEPIEIEFEYVDGQWKKVSGDITISNVNNITMQIENQPYIRLSGMVWEDRQTGVKQVQGPNGKKDDGEEKLPGVLVGLYSVKEKKILQAEGLKPRLTDENGQYEFKDIPKTNEGYKIVFSYDGINWQETKSIRGANDGDSDASESPGDREPFNYKFKTISKNLATSGDGATTALEYIEEEGKSTLKVDMAGNTTGTADAKFQMKASTPEAYKIITENIDCGLVKKELDLAIGTDVKTATLKINDKETTYNYQQIMNGAMKDLTLDDILQNNSSTSKEDVKYNLNLYASDYNYRIEDYNGGITNNINSEEKYNPEEDGTLEELETYVTYSVVLKNQTTHDATINQFVYYYDEIYAPYNINSTDEYEVSIDEANRKITFTSKENGLNVNKNDKDGNINNDYRKEIELTFKLDINSEVYKNLVSTSREAKNVAEITSYSTTTGGLIDKDSAPDNANITSGNGIHYEDDTDEAKTIKISVKEEVSRTITGTVFNDTYKNSAGTEYDKDGVLNNSNNRVNDVIVQLIEIKKINGKYYEYIWQETRSGSGKVKTTARNGYDINEYPNSVQPGSGQYEFKDFIPGNYIIRFIYGDGRTLDVNSQAYKNTAEYNGQDYKSTIDLRYKAEWYNTARYANEQSSVARDNEARRLEVMAYSSTINEEVGKALEEKTSLDKTWMAAETSKINVPVDADNTSTTADKTTASYEYTRDGKKVGFNNVHFGLALRPQTKLVLEKHITGLRITPKGNRVQSIIDARANIENIINKEAVEIKGVTEGLAVIYSDRNNRGFWQVATDVEQLIQGAALETEYTYVLKNEGEKDYLSTILVNAYEGYKTNEDGTRSDEALGMSYQDYLKILKYDTRGKTNSYGTYLGQVYYRGLNPDGKVPTTDVEVSSRVEKLEEAINNDLIFSEGTHFRVKEQEKEKTIFGIEGDPKTEKINTVVENINPTAFLTTEGIDYSKTIKLTKTLASESGGELGANLPSYIAEITTYSNAAGRRDMSSEPANLSYVHSEDNRITLDTYKDGNTYYQIKNGIIYKLDATNQTDYEKTDLTQIPDTAVKVNENDEFWAETIIITKPTGEDKLTPMQIALITISAVATLGVGIVLIKKYVLKR